MRLLLALLYFLAVPAAPLWAAGEELRESASISEVNELPMALRNGTFGLPSSFLPRQSPALSFPQHLKSHGIRLLSPARQFSRTETAFAIAPHQTASTLDVLEEVQYGSLHTETTDIPERASLEADFPAYDSFLRDLDRQYVENYGSDRIKFLEAVEQNRFHHPEKGVGEFETKLIEGRVCIKFLPSKSDRPLVVLIANPPLAVNEGASPLQVSPLSSKADSGASAIDPALGSKKLEVYRSRLLVRKVPFGTRRGVLILDHWDGIGRYSPPLPPVHSLSWGRGIGHWVRANYEAARAGDWIRGGMAAIVEGGVGYGLALAGAHLLHTSTGFAWIAGLASALNSLVLTTYTDTYINIVQRGDNRSWESAKRLMFSTALLNFPLLVIQSHFQAALIFSKASLVELLLIGFGDRYASTLMNVVPKIHQKYYLKPWFFPLRMKMPFTKSPVKGVTMTREALALPRFTLRFLGLVLDAPLKKFTFGLPVATILLWTMGASFELVNYYSLKRLVKQNPRVQEDLDLFTGRYLRWLRPFRNRSEP